MRVFTASLRERSLRSSSLGLRYECDRAAFDGFGRAAQRRDLMPSSDTASRTFASSRAPQVGSTSFCETVALKMTRRHGLGSDAGTVGLLLCGVSQTRARPSRRHAVDQHDHRGDRERKLSHR